LGLWEHRPASSLARHPNTDELTTFTTLQARAHTH
jgi:hypothetical protein